MKFGLAFNNTLFEDVKNWEKQQGNWDINTLQTCQVLHMLCETHFSVV